jgi:hypothetical protein
VETKVPRAVVGKAPSLAGNDQFRQENMERTPVEKPVDTVHNFSM